MNQSDPVVLNRSQAQETRGSHNSATTPSRRTSSSASSRSQRRSPSPEERSGSKTPLTPEESPPFKSTATRKRDAGIVEAEDKEIDDSEATPTHARQDSGDSGIHVCICQPDPKIRRPRNAFILYRQHHQANVVAQNPGLANPEISKIIGEQWQNQSPEVKNKWKALAEEEKLRHQQQYPTYRYQPKRSGRRNSQSSDCSGKKAKCAKCGGRSILAPSTPFSNVQSSNPSPAGPQTPSSAITPVSRTLPVLRDLSLQSPAARRLGKQFPSSNMSPLHAHPDDRDDLGPLSQDLKRRRYNGEHAPTLSRAMPTRYAAAPAAPQSGPGTPFPFAQAPPHPYPPGAAHSRRESLPGLRGMVSSPGAMAPPPRPGPGYQQHRLSQGHIPHDRSLTLPPLQTSTTANVPSALATAGAGKTAKEQIMNLDFRHKISVLRRVAPPTPLKKSALRGPLLVVEGDNVEAVKDLGKWLSDTLRKDDDLTVSLRNGPTLSADGSKEKLMAQYHRLAAEWLDKSGGIRDSLAIRTSSPTDSVMVDAAPAVVKAGRDIDENYDDSDSSTSKAKAEKAAEGRKETGSERAKSDASKMDVDTASKGFRSSMGDSAMKDGGSSSSSAKPISIIANYSLHASNFFACNIPIDAHDPYAPTDHWQWTATQWRGIISPDLTIYVRDGVTGDSGKQSVDILDEGNLFVVKRTKADGKETLEIEPSTLRRLGFEVSEWVRAFGSNAE
ncbi:hypothetical protein M409DRAFT_64818 [Zasmidium cellare ATCC 36951]|uniref:HMG box domain-containing protein n=1 Tax=Zasmidium cellare ATCC 36951 TaxID=1080233 RepID=A0A6A6CRB4_ZASCE|nr:uncharacterized protein M409DRAFT_64818 [Zasmidium cellare ATCC 36951]KAF2169817.1 hypothetical protein M409DRAFT_64818 [Zasmidium cellare ATCC 36951]